MCAERSVQIHKEPEQKLPLKSRKGWRVREKEHVFTSPPFTLSAFFTMKISYYKNKLTEVKCLAGI